MLVRNMSIRSFIAIELPERVRSELKKLQGSLKSPQLDFVRWVPTENIHITLKFLGNISSAQVDDIVDVMKELSPKFEPFELEVGGIGIFPNLRRPRVLWAGCGGDMDSLQALQGSLENRLTKLGFAKEPRGFTPHLTIARLREDISPEQRRVFSDLIGGWSTWLGCRFVVDAISLMKSQLLPSGAVYTRIAQTKLGS